jgi:broad specificity phosphatase PhoE
MRILIIRHADPEYNGDTLTAAGHAEAEALARRLCRPKKEGAGRLSKIFTSPMGRACATAEYTEKLSGISAEVLEWTRELTYWPKLGTEQRPGEGGMALWDVSGEVGSTPFFSYWSRVSRSFSLISRRDGKEQNA